MLDVPALMKALALDRPVFHSEADFQHALAWKVHETHPSARIRLERRVDLLPLGSRKPIYLDLWVQIDGQITAIELKYQTVVSRITYEGEQFNLLNKGAEDNLGYDFISDVARLERFIEAYPGAAGHAILLSNERLWHFKPTGRQYNKDAFRIYHGRELNGTLSWRDSSKAKERAAALEIKGNYTTEWQDYSGESGKAGAFRYLWIPVGTANQQV